MKFKEIWRESLSRRIVGAEGLEAVAAEQRKKGYSHSQAWEMLAMPEGTTWDFDTAVEIATGAPGHPLIAEFLGWGVQAMERALADPRFEIEGESTRRAWKIPGIFPGNHGKVLVGLALARAMRDDAEPDRDMLIQGAREIAQSELESKGADWLTAQSGYLRSVNIMLVAGETANAKAMLAVRKKFSHTQQHFDWLKAFVMAIPEEAPCRIIDPQAIDDFQKRFDLYRDPFYKKTYKDANGGNMSESLIELRLELALLKQRYISGMKIAGNWSQVIGYIAE
jgi:hypothetical protein